MPGRRHPADGARDVRRVLGGARPRPGRALHRAGAERPGPGQDRGDLGDPGVGHARRGLRPVAVHRGRARSVLRHARGARPPSDRRGLRGAGHGRRVLGRGVMLAVATGFLDLFLTG